MSSHFKCALTHVVFGVLLFVMGIVDLGLSFRDEFIGLIGFKFSVIFSGVWVGKIIFFPLCCKRKQTKVTYFSLHHL